MVTIPACLLGIVIASVASYKRGKDLDKDPEFQKKIADPAQREYIYGSNATTLDKKIAPESKRAVYIFFGALLVIVFFAIFQDLLPTYDTVKAIDGDATVELMASRVKITADQLAKLGITVDGLTKTNPTPLKSARPRPRRPSLVPFGRAVWWPLSPSMVSHGWPTLTLPTIWAKSSRCWRAW